MAKTIDLRRQRKVEVNGLTFTNDDKLRVDAAFSGTITTGAIEFEKNGVDSTVALDTSNPANNNPLPVNLFNENGERGTEDNPLFTQAFVTTDAKNTILLQNILQEIQITNKLLKSILG